MSEVLAHCARGFPPVSPLADDTLPRLMNDRPEQPDPAGRFDLYWADDIQAQIILALTDPDDPAALPERTTAEIDQVLDRGIASTAAQLRQMRDVRRAGPGRWRGTGRLALAGAYGRRHPDDRQAA